MELLPSADQEAIIKVAAEFIAEEMPVAGIRVRRQAAESFDREVWAACAELGWFGLGLPSGLGGADFTLAEEALLFREIGRGLAPGPFLPTVLGARVAAVAGNRDVCERILSGASLVGLAQLRGDDGGWVDGGLSGQIDLIDSAGCDLVVVIGEEAAALVDLADLEAVEAVPCLDPGARLATATARRVPPRALVTSDQDPVRLRGLVLVAALGVGVSEAVRDMAVQHAKTRVQFGRPIGVNQAIKHRCADMATLAQAALSQLYFAAASFASGRPDIAFQANAAKVIAVRAAVTNAEENIQVHGGMGYTDEHDAHLYLRRARVIHHLMGETTDSLATLLRLPPAD